MRTHYHSFVAHDTHCCPPRVRWYPPLREFTFETIFVDMSVADAEAFVAYQERLLAEFSIEEPGMSIDCGILTNFIVINCTLSHRAGPDADAAFTNTHTHTHKHSRTHAHTLP